MSRFRASNAYTHTTDDVSAVIFMPSADHSAASEIGISQNDKTEIRTVDEKHNPFSDLVE
jgi:hypothetical protein